MQAGLGVIVALAIAGCAGDGDGGATMSLTGAGATFPNPVYQRWFYEYHRSSGVQINYQSIGSGGGIRQYSEHTVDFGATDGPMKDDAIAALDGNVWHIPTVIGAVVLTYNLPQLGDAQLILDGPTTADIFLGRIFKWNDRRIAALNPDVSLPDDDILVVHRSDGSGTTFIFSDYLSKVSTAWAGEVGANKSLEWPTGLGAKGNEGVTQQVLQLENTIGYVEFIYAESNGLPHAKMMNAAGKLVDPTLETASAAAASVTFAPDTDFRISITNADGDEAYPITSFTWLLVQPRDSNFNRARTIKNFLSWMISEEGQMIAMELKYAPLPAQVVELVRARIDLLGAGPGD